MSSAKGKQGVAWFLENQTYEFNGKPYKVDICYCDSGYMTGTVYDEARSTYPGLINPTKGSGASGTYGRSAVKTNDLDLFIYSDFSLKVELYQNMFNNKEIVLPRDTDAELIAGLSGQMMVVDPSGKRHWRKVDGDHYGDCLKLCVLSSWVACENDDVRDRLRPAIEFASS